ncbi:peptide deformylase [Planctomycetes bacterium K23_9]|uniref:Peptide deformylase n=1 Tax=Stieleria marina TaxID=1930275 RepID=A0A517NVD4_9BACT|nr:Peptide deformylase [Planctomycetes bacterium K23_9]
MDLSVVSFPHPTLRYKSKPIMRVDAELHAIADRMLELMYEHNGVGLAANQVDLPIRMFVMNPAGKKDEGEEWVVINPEISKPKGTESAEEGCLSLPGLYGDVKRPKSVYLSAYDISGKPIEMEVDGFASRVIQHEKDHLDGVMFFDRMPDESRRELDYQLEEMDTDFRSKQSTGAIPPDDELVARLKTWTDKYA